MSPEDILMELIEQAEEELDRELEPDELDSLVEAALAGFDEAED